MKTNKYLLAFTVMNLILVYLYRPENFVFGLLVTLGIVIPNEIFRRSNLRIAEGIMGYGSGFMIGFIVGISWHAAILISLLLGIFFCLNIIYIKKAAKETMATTKNRRA